MLDDNENDSFFKSSSPSTFNGNCVTTTALKGNCGEMVNESVAGDFVLSDFEWWQWWWWWQRWWWWMRIILWCNAMVKCLIEAFHSHYDSLEAINFAFKLKFHMTNPISYFLWTWRWNIISFFLFDEKRNGNVWIVIFSQFKNGKHFAVLEIIVYAWTKFEWKLEGN